MDRDEGYGFQTLRMLRIGKNKTKRRVAQQYGVRAAEHSGITYNLNEKRRSQDS